MRYKRIVLKLSGGAISGKYESGFDPLAIDYIADEILAVYNKGVQIGITMGGGNIFRGHLCTQWGIERAEADNIGMMGTIINSLMMRGVLTARSEGKVEVRVMTAMPVNTVAEPYIRLRAINHLEKGYIIIFAGGIGNPYVTTDYPGVQRTLEVRAEAIFYAKHKTSGIFTDDPNKNPNAKLYRRVNYNTVVHQDLDALDQSAVILARDNNLPIHVFDFDRKGSMERVLEGEDVGTVILQTSEDAIEQ